MKTNRNNIQTSMIQELNNKSLYEKALKSGFDYLEEAFERHIYPKEAALQQLEHFDEAMPQDGFESQVIIDDLIQYGSPATVAQIGGRYFGFVNGSVVPAGLAAKLLATFWDQNAGMHVISPIVSKLETVVEQWFKEIFDLPESACAGFVTGTSAANFCGLAAARYRLLKRKGWDINEKGLFGAPKIRIVTGKEAHSSAIKAVNLLGFGNGNIEWVEVDDQGRLIAEKMPELDDSTIVILQAGNVNSGSFDPFDAVCEKARKANAWVHIDGAFGLWAHAVDQLKYLTKGLEKANSWAVDGHKTLNTPYDCGIVMCEDKEALVSAMHMSGGYLVLSEQRDGMFYTADMSRRSRIIELWATMKYLGKSGIDQMVLGMHERAKQFTEILRATEGFEVLNDVVFNQVVVHCESDELTETVIKHIQALRECWLGGSYWSGKRVFRISVCSWATTEQDVVRSVDSFKKALEMAKQHAD